MISIEQHTALHMIRWLEESAYSPLTAAISKAYKNALRSTLLGLSSSTSVRPDPAIRPRYVCSLCVAVESQNGGRSVLSKEANEEITKFHHALATSIGRESVRIRSFYSDTTWIVKCGGYFYDERNAPNDSVIKPLIQCNGSIPNSLSLSSPE